MSTPNSPEELIFLQEMWVFFYTPFFWFVASWVVAWAAEQRQRSHTWWFIMSLCMTPAFAVLVLIAVGSKKTT